MGDEATTPFLSRIGGEIFQNYGHFSHSVILGKTVTAGGRAFLRSSGRGRAFYPFCW